MPEFKNDPSSSVRQCSSCKAVKTVDAYPKTGARNFCLRCRADYALKRFHNRTPEQRKIQRARWLKWYHKNKKAYRERYNAYRRERRQLDQKHRTKLLIESRQFYDVHRDCVLQYARRYMLKKKFGITIEEYERMSMEQKGKCAICLLPQRDGRRLAVDHCHNTKKIRGLLCDNCNQSLGKFKEDPDRFIAAANYLRKHQTTSSSRTRR